MAERIILEIDNEYCLSLDQLKGYFARDFKPDTRLYEELLTLQCDGMLQQWLEQGTTDEEQELARRLKDLSGKQTNSELMGELIRIFTGHCGKIDKPQPSTFFDLQAVECRVNGQQVSLSSSGKHLNAEKIVLPNDKTPLPEVQVSLSFKVKKKANEQFCIRLMTQEGLILKSESLSLQIQKVGSTINVDFASVILSIGDTVLSITVDGEQWIVLQVSVDVAPQSFIVNGVLLKMIYVEGGKFSMGATTEQGIYVNNDEWPAHEVILSGYYIGETPVTQELWQAVMGNNPSRFEGLKRPVECVSWDDCQTFITKLNGLLKDQLGGRRFHLPSEAQWEYAARGGQKSRHYKNVGSNDVSLYRKFYTFATHDVKQKEPNELGLYEMNGNVSQWCQDLYGVYSSIPQTDPIGPSSGFNRVFRGSSWFDDVEGCRMSSRGSGTPWDMSSKLGLRLALY